MSIGVDDISNTMLISVQEELYDSVVGMVNELDQEAASDTVVRVHRVNGNVAAAALRETINGSMSQPWIGGKPDPNAMRGRGDVMAAETTAIGIATEGAIGTATDAIVTATTTATMATTTTTTITTAITTTTTIRSRVCMRLVARA